MKDMKLIMESWRKALNENKLEVKKIKHKFNNAYFISLNGVPHNLNGPSYYEIPARNNDEYFIEDEYIPRSEYPERKNKYINQQRTMAVEYLKKNFQPDIERIIFIVYAMLSSHIESNNELGMVVADKGMEDFPEHAKDIEKLITDIKSN